MGGLSPSDDTELESVMVYMASYKECACYSTRLT